MLIRRDPAVVAATGTTTGADYFCPYSIMSRFWKLSWRSFSMCCSCSPLLQWRGKATRACSSEISSLRFLAGSSDRRTPPQCTITGPRTCLTSFSIERDQNYALSLLRLCLRAEEKTQTLCTRCTHMKALHVNVAFMGGTVVIAAMVLAFVQTLR